MSGHLIRGVSFDLDTGGAVIEYVTPADDVRENGLVRNHALLIPPTDQFDESIVTLLRAAETALQFCLDAYGQAPPLDLTPEPDDDSAGPYDNPNERDLT